VKKESYLELVCPAGTLASLHAAVDAGADTVYCGFRDSTNARNYPGLNFDNAEMAEGAAYAHKNGCKVLVAINTFPRAGEMKRWQAAVDNAVEAGADAIIVADIGVMDYASRPDCVCTCLCKRQRPTLYPLRSTAIVSRSSAWFCRASFRWKRYPA